MIKNAIYEPNMGEPIPKIKMAFFLYSMRLTEFYRIQGIVSTMISSPLLSQSHNESVRLFVEIPRISIASCTKGGLSATVLCTECEKNTHKMKRKEMGRKKKKLKREKKKKNGMHRIALHWHCACATSSHVLLSFSHNVKQLNCIECSNSRIEIRLLPMTKTLLHRIE